MNVDQLRFLIEINKCKSLAQAAENLHISHQALSASIKSLEKELETPLTEKTHRGTKLTLKGKQLVEISYDFIHALDDIFVKNKEEKMQVKIASSYSCITNFLASKIQELNATPVYIEENENQNIIKLVSDGTADIGFCSVFTSKQISGQRVFQNALLQHPLVESRRIIQLMILCELTETHPLAYLEKIPLYKLKKYPLLYYYPRTILSEDTMNDSQFMFIKYWENFDFTIENNPRIYTQKIKSEGYVGIVITEELANPYTHVRLPLSDECGFNIFAVRHCKGKYTSIEEKLYNL